MADVTVRDFVNTIRNEVRDSEVSPERAAILATQLSALLGNIAAEIRKADMAYNAVFAGFLDTEKKANRAKVRAEGSDAYLAKREAHDLHMVAVEMVRSLRKLQDTYREEMRLTR